MLFAVSERFVVVIIHALRAGRLISRDIQMRQVNYHIKLSKTASGV